MRFVTEVEPCLHFLRDELDRWLQSIAKHVLPPLNGGMPWGIPIPCPAGPGGAIGVRDSRVMDRPLLLRGGADGSSEQKNDLEIALKFVLTMKRQCALYLYATTKAIEFTPMGSPTMICEDETDIHRYMDSVETLFSATFNTFNELLSRDAVHRRVGMRMTAEEYYDLNTFDRVHKLIRFIILVFQVLCQTQSAFKNVPVPARLEAHVQG